MTAPLAAGRRADAPNGLVHSTAARVTDAPAIDLERDLPMRVAGRFSVAAVGDIVQTRCIAGRSDPLVQSALSPLREADIAIGNLEQTIAERRSFEGGAYGVPSFLVMAAPEIAQDLADAGLRLLCRANNRLSDFGVKGNRETDRHLRAAGIAPFGFGEHLAAARAPVHAETAKARVAAVGVTATVNHNLDTVFAAGLRAGLSNGRPGASALRVVRTIHLPPPAYEALRRLALEHDYAFPGGFVVVPNVMVFEDRFKLGAEWYVADETPGYSYAAHPDDLGQVLRSVKNGALLSDFCVLSIHSHQWMIDAKAPRGGLDGEVPEVPDFLVDLAARAVAAGADMVCVHGPFEFKAIAVVSGKPVFYGLGSFVRHAYALDAVPAEMYAALDNGIARHAAIDPAQTELSDAEIVMGRTVKHPSRYFEGASAVCHFEDGRLNHIAIHPLDLGFGGSWADLGTPRTAEGAQASRILQAIAERSRRFGTVLVQEGDVGIVRPGPRSSTERET